MMILGSRGSALALAQTSWVRERILDLFPGAEVAIHVIRTSADKDESASIRSGSAVGVFVREIEEALLRGEIDAAVHSMKDLPTRIPQGLRIAAVPQREDALDALVTPDGKNLDNLPQGARVGTGSLRRQAQLLALRPDLQVKDIRGNIDTRLKKLRAGAYDAVVLACAGLKRLGLADAATQRLNLAEMLPAPGQGALAVETRIGDLRINSVTAALNHWETAVAVAAERAFLSRMGGGCNVPVAAHARIRDGSLILDGLVASPDGSKMVRDTVRASPDAAEDAAVALAETILERGGRAVLDGLPQSLV